MSRKHEVKAALADAMLRGAKKWRCPNCGFEMMSVERPKCGRHSIHVVPFSDYEKSFREGGLWMEEADE